MDRNIEKVFLWVLREDANKEEIDKKTRHFKDNDWQELLDFSIANGILPLFYTRLLSLKLENIPTGFLSNLKALYLTNLKRNIVLEKELLRVISHLKDNNIPVIPLKGPALAEFLYDDLSLRQTSCDLDLLVRKEQLEQAEYALKEIGCSSCYGGEDGSLRNFNLKYYRELGFIKDSNRLSVELHIDIRQLFTFAPLEDFWANIREFDIGGNKILVPSHESLLVYLSLVAMSINEFIGLRYLYDIHMLISKFKRDLNWKGLYLKLKNARYRGAVFFALKLSRDFFSSDIPQHFLKKIKPGGIKVSFLRLWINKRNVLRIRRDSGYSWYYFFTAWHYFVSSYLYSKGVFDCITIIYRKIFLPLDGLAACYNLPSSKASYFLYIKRVLKPISNLWLRKYNRK